MTLTDGSILRRIGLQLQRDSHGVAMPRTSQREHPYHSKDVAARCLHTATEDGAARPSLPVPCAWCDAEAGIKPNPNMQQSHTVCDRHMAAIKADLERRRLAEAA
jgi:hypothetical protein